LNIDIPVLIRFSGGEQSEIGRTTIRIGIFLIYMYISVDLSVSMQSNTIDGEKGNERGE
tara:strand:- start:172 stop:348 length:177 start_codon:yes stop_codon:yes gene_type:complete